MFFFYSSCLHENWVHVIAVGKSCSDLRRISSHQGENSERKSFLDLPASGEKEDNCRVSFTLECFETKRFWRNCKIFSSWKNLLDVYSIPSTLICWLHKFWRQKTLHFIFFVSKNYFKFKFNIPKLLNSLNFFYIFIFPQDNKMPSTHHSGSKTQSVHSTKRPQPWNFNWISENSVKKIWKSRSSQSEWMKLVIN